MNLQQGRTSERYLDTVNTTEKYAWEVTLEVQGNPVIFKFKVDTGAEVTALSESAWNSLDLNLPLSEAEISLFGPDRSKLKVLGMATVLLVHKTNSCTQSI